MHVDQSALAKFYRAPQGGCGGVPGAAQAAVQRALGNGCERCPSGDINGLVVLSSRSLPWPGNNARRAGNNSPPRSDPRSELRRAPDPDSADNFLARFETSSPGSEGTGKIRFSGIELFVVWRWSCVPRCDAVPRDDVQKCFSYRSVCYAAGAVQRLLEELSACRTISDPAQAAAKLRWKLCGEVGRSIKHKELAEQIRTDNAYVERQSGLFKLPDQGARAFCRRSDQRGRLLHIRHISDSHKVYYGIFIG